MRQPADYEDTTEKVCKLNNSLHGFKQSPRLWNKLFKAVMETYGLRVNNADPCLFVNATIGYKFLICLYINNGFFAAEKEKDVTYFLAELQKEVQVTLKSS